MLTCVLSMAFFGDSFALSPSAAVCAVAVLVGFVLLSSDTIMQDDMMEKDPPLLLDTDGLPILPDTRVSEEVGDAL